MLTLLSIVTLLVFVFIRPHEMNPALARLPLLNVLFAATIIALVADSRVKLRATSQVVIAIGFLLWSLASLALSGRGELVGSAIALAVPIILFVSLAWGACNFRRLKVATTAVVLCSALLAVVGAHQARAPRGCVEFTGKDGADLSLRTFDGRSCENRLECYEDIDNFEVEYTCERIGLLDTTSFNGRVRYRGTLNDPNEFALAIVVALPLLLAIARIRAGAHWWLFAAGISGATLFAVLASQSRGGLLALLVAAAVGLIYRYKIRGLVLTGLGGLAGLVFMGSRGGGAAASVYERYDAWSVALNLLTSRPIFGVGQDGFLDYHYLTAHNSYLLIAAEAGFVGLVLFSSVLYISIKIPLSVLAKLPPSPGNREVAIARTFALAMVASLAALMTGMLFLSLSYHQVIWVYLGLAGALQASLATSNVEIPTRFSAGDLMLVAAADLTLLLGFRIFLLLKGL